MGFADVLTDAGASSTLIPRTTVLLRLVVLC